LFFRNRQFIPCSKNACEGKKSIKREVLFVKTILFNGSPRKNWNTAALLNSALEGAASEGAETELIHLYDLNFKGCQSCFACKTKGGKSYGKCAIKDDLASVLKKVEEADAIILGSPIYFGEVTGEMRSFMERLMFPFGMYTNPYQSLFPRRINVGLIYNGNITQDQFLRYSHLNIAKEMLELIFGKVESFFSFDTLQFEDYSKVVADSFDPEKKAKVRREIFPKDCKKAFEMGARLSRKE
jgi:multimeric flavodoxin WrbA